MLFAGFRRDFTKVRAGDGDQLDPGAAEIRGQLRRILASPEFVRSTRMCQFLELVVENSLAGEAPLKETAIGARVFSRAPDYDSSAEPIVRVEARRLRQKLQQYYGREGPTDPIVIHLPKGGYAPTFEIRAAISVIHALPHTHWRRYAGAAGAAAAVAALAVWIAWRPSSRLPGMPPAPPPRPVVSIAVLPLVNISGDPSQDYLADGMTDELIGSLAKIPSLRVISPTSAMQLKGTRKALREIAKELSVDAVVEGSLVRSGRQVRITARLMDAKQGHPLWSEDYLRPAGDMLVVESEVARAVAAQVRLAFSPSQEAQLRRQAGVAPGAWDAYLNGRYYWNERTESGLRKSIGYFRQAVARAPGYALAWAGLADSWLLLGESWVRPNTQAFAEAQNAADQALALDDDLGEAHASLAALDSDRGQWERAEAEFRRALELSPGYATAHQWYAEGLAAHGRTAEALVEIRRARELDPLSITVNVQVGYILFLARRYDEAIGQLRLAIRTDPYFWMAHADLGHAYEEARMYPEAIRELRKSVDQTHGSARQRLWLAHALALAGHLEEARRMRPALEESFKQGQTDALPMALLDIALGERDRALARIQDACREHRLGTVSPTPLFDPLRTDSRIAAVLDACRMQRAD